jgi:hypothetical protein
MAAAHHIHPTTAAVPSFSMVFMAQTLHMLCGKANSVSSRVVKGPFAGSRVGADYGTLVRARVLVRQSSHCLHIAGKMVGQTNM